MIKNAQHSEATALATNRFASLCEHNNLKFTDLSLFNELQVAVHSAFNIRDPSSSLLLTHIMWLDFTFDRKQTNLRRQFTLLEGGLLSNKKLLEKHWQWIRGPSDPLLGTDPVLHSKIPLSSRLANTAPPVVEACRVPGAGMVLILSRFRVAEMQHSGNILPSCFVVSPESSVQECSRYEHTDGTGYAPLFPVQDWLGWLQRSQASSERPLSVLEAMEKWTEDAVQWKFPEIRFTERELATKYRSFQATTSNFSGAEAWKAGPLVKWSRGTRGQRSRMVVDRKSVV